MKTACGIIRDLLPLYAENMTGEESGELIREHVAECRDCSDYLEKLQNPICGGNPAASSSEGSLKLVRMDIRRRKVTAVLFSASLVFVVMLAAFSHMVRPDYVSYPDSGITVVESGNGNVYAQFSDSVTSCRVIRSVNEAGQSVVELEAWTSLWDRFFGKTTPSVLISSESEKTDVAYYCDLSTENDNAAVIYGASAGGGLSLLPRLVLGYYFMLAFAAAAVLGLARIIFRKNKKASRIFGYLFAAPLSYLLGHLITTTSFVSFSAANDFIFNCAAALAIYGVLISGSSLLRQHKQDKIGK